MPSRLDIYLNRISHLSQVFLVAFAIFGYFYTVRPIYQKELLSEDIAKKEFELNGLKKELKRSSDILQGNILAQSELLKDIDSLNVQQDELERKLKSTNAELSESIRALKQQRSLAKKAVDDNNRNLSSVFWENFNGLIGNTYLRSSINRVNKSLSSSPSYPKFDELYVKPYTAISNAIKMGNHNFYESAGNIPERLRNVLLKKISIALEKNKERLNKYPDGFEDKVKLLQGRMKIYDSRGNTDDIMKRYEIDRELRHYIDSQNKISWSIASDFLALVQKTN
ncbi:hypothetical protein [Pantoea sp. Cy-640]|uniref:hypothetical protein n=1 Tax=Pantoea sp. Cy-640 TaxID=2608353 RepID=UPI0014195101|nr:hypothetical protein [Pantoea sp. Cy-640]NIG14056.1 hypothetical protein [Pantoea sp. Cy-640]